MGQTNCHTGHRQRLKAEFKAGGFQGWSDHRVLEFLLGFAIPQGDLNPLAHRLIDRFGDLAGVLDAPLEVLVSVPGIGEHTALFLKALPKAAGRYLSQIEGTTETAGMVRDFYRILVPYFVGATQERLCALSLDSRGKPLGVDVLEEGETSIVKFSLRRVLAPILARNAVGVVLAHNHVGAYARPSDADKVATQKLEALFASVGITLVDHLILSGSEAISFRESGMLGSETLEKQG